MAAALLISVVSFGQRTVSGTITDEDNSPLIGATVLVKSTDSGTLTDENGQFTVVANENDVLLINYVGMITKEMRLGSESNVSIQMDSDAAALSEVIVTTTRQPVRKIETTTAVSVINSQILEAQRPEGFSEAIQGTPGVYTSQSQGRFRGAIFTRGFPDGSGNGLIYTGILLDGIPSLATPARPPDFAFGMDMNVDRIEVVRGSAATLFGRSSAAGVVNVISKVGGAESKGSVRATYYNSNVDREGRGGLDYKLDANMNGPISDRWRYNVGGYYVKDKGFRDLGYNDRGGQIRTNIDYLGDNLTFRVYGGYTNVSIQNMIDIPYRLSDNTPREGWETTDSYYDDIYDTYTSPLNPILGISDGHFQITDKEGNPQQRSFQAANEDGNYARGFNIGANVDFDLGNGWSITNMLRYQNYDHGTKFNLGVSTFYFNDPFNPTDLLNLRILIDGDGNDSDLIDEFRINKEVAIGGSTHRFSLGTYFSRGWYTPETYSWFHIANAEAGDIRVGFFNDFGVPTLVGTNPVPFGSTARRDEYTITVNSFFFGDEMKLADDQLTVNAGVRYDKVNMDIQGFYNDPMDVQREEEHSDISWSLGLNYLLNERSSIYGNYVSAFRMPDYGAYTPADPASLIDNPDIEENERVNNFELGYRTGVGDLGIDVAAFYTKINNRLATVYEGAIAVIKPLGTNVINGAEIGLTLTPSAAKGLLLRASATYQNATFDEFKIPVGDSDPTGETFGNTYVSEGTDADGNPVFSLDLQGNQVPRVPSFIFNFMANYSSNRFGVDASMNYFANRYADATNIFKQDNILNVNLGAHLKHKLKGGTQLKLGLLVKNLLNTDKALRFLYVSDNDAALARQQLIGAGTATAENTFYTGIPYLPRRLLLSLSVDF